MKLFFDTEFTGLYKDTTLISLGIIAEDGRKFYAEFLDYNPKQCDDWIRENVLDNCFLHPIYYGVSKEEIEKKKKDGYIVDHIPSIPREDSVAVHFIKYTSETGITNVCGDKGWIGIFLGEWLSQFDSVQFVSDVCHYDFVLLIDIFGGAFDLPKNICPACHDINQDIANHYGISEAEAFDKSREKIIDNSVPGRKHNALYDAEVIKAIYEKVRSEQS